MRGGMARPLSNTLMVRCERSEPRTTHPACPTRLDASHAANYLSRIRTGRPFTMQSAADTELPLRKPEDSDLSAVKTLRKALTILDAFAGAERPLTVAEVAIMTGSPGRRRTAWCRRSSPRAFSRRMRGTAGISPGYSVLQLAGRLLDFKPASPGGAAASGELAQSCGERSNLGILHRGADTFPGRRGEAVAADDLQPLRQDGAGLLRLARQGDPRRAAAGAARRISRRTGRSFGGPRTRSRKQTALRKELARIKRQGYAVDREEYIDGDLLRGGGDPGRREPRRRDRITGRSLDGTDGACRRDPAYGRGDLACAQPRRSEPRTVTWLGGVMNRLDLATAQIIVAEAIAYARQAGIEPLTVVVLDDRAAVKAAGADDGIQPARFEIARGKAAGCLAFGFGARELQKRPPAFLAAVGQLPGVMIVPVPGRRADPRRRPRHPRRRRHFRRYGGARRGGRRRGHQGRGARRRYGRRRVGEAKRALHAEARHLAWARRFAPLPTLRGQLGLEPEDADGDGQHRIIAENAGKLDRRRAAEALDGSREKRVRHVVQSGKTPSKNRRPVPHPHRRRRGGGRPRWRR